MYHINDIIGKTNWYAQISIRLFHFIKNNFVIDIECKEMQYLKIKKVLPIKAATWIKAAPPHNFYS